MILWNQAAIVYEMLTPAPEAQEINFGSLSLFKRMSKMLATKLRLVLLFIHEIMFYEITETKIFTPSTVSKRKSWMTANIDCLEVIVVAYPVSPCQQNP